MSTEKKTENYAESAQKEMSATRLRLVTPSPVTHPLLDILEAGHHGKLTLHTPEGQVYTYDGHDHPDVQACLYLNNWSILDAVLMRGEIGFAESYIDNAWESDNLPALLIWTSMNIDLFEDYLYGRPFYVLWMRFKALFSANSLNGSKRNILKHYDLGNDFYALWLDKSMTYSGGLFGGDPSLSLEEAQQAKYNRILGQLHAQEGDHILEIGCGWGGFAEVAARRGMRVTSITISDKQKNHAQDRIKAAGLDHLAEIKFQDYREVTGQFDHIVSIGMFEHVGMGYWPVYFKTLQRCLKPGGTALVQTILLDDMIFEKTLHKHGFIETYIFPGGQLPSKSRFCASAQKAGLLCQDIFPFGQDYALTLRHWLQNFEANRDSIEEMGHSPAFIRMWRFYLASCIAAFTTRRTNVAQFTLQHR